MDEITITTLLIGIICLSSIYGFSNKAFMEKMILHPVTIAQKREHFRLISHGFVHADWGHLFFNMFSLYFFGLAVEHDLGQTLTALLFLVGILFAALPSYYNNRHDYRYLSLGASGGVSAVVFCSIVYHPLQEMMIFPIPIPIKGFILGGMYLAFSYYQDKQGAGHINHSAHLYGAIFGIIFAFIANPAEAFMVFSKIFAWIGSF
jgi:membrane associated rhomboid family serine protease